MSQSEKYLDIGIDIEQCRQLHNLPQLKPMSRQCLRCGAPFESEGNHNRICFYCKVDFRTIPTSVCDYNFNVYRSLLRYTLERRMKKKCY